MTCEGGEEGGGEDVDRGREKHPAQPVKPWTRNLHIYIYKEEHDL